MPELCDQLKFLLIPPACLVGLGNADYADDGLGLHLAEALQKAGLPHVFLAGNNAERWLPRLAAEGYRHLLLLDAVEFGGAAGSVILLSGPEIRARYPQVSTHKISLGTMAAVLENEHQTNVSLLGVQPETLRVGQPMSESVRKTVNLLFKLLKKAHSSAQNLPLPHEAPMIERTIQA